LASAFSDDGPFKLAARRGVHPSSGRLILNKGKAGHRNDDPDDTPLPRSHKDRQLTGEHPIERRGQHVSAITSGYS
jgi:hypothetical protein